MDPVRFGKYFLVDIIASGGMAEIYKAMVKSSEGQFHTLAIKRILPQFSKDEEFISLLTDEAKVMVFLNHPNIVSIVEFGKIEGSYYIAMDYIDGPTLQALFRKVREAGKQIPIYIALYVVREIAAGLAYAHRKTDQDGRALSLVHRDISPGNILLSFDGEIKITDFGISKVSNQNHETQVGVIRGKTGYMSPEQTRAGLLIDSRTDLYALGIILFELITGERLYKADSVPQALKMIREGKIPSPKQLRPEIHENLEALILKALSQDPNSRFQSGEEFSDAINEFLARYYTGPKKRVTYNDLVEYMSEFFKVSTKAERLAEKSTNEKTLSNIELEAKLENSSLFKVGEREATSSKVYAANPMFSLEATENQIVGNVSLPVVEPDKANTESLIHAPKGSIKSLTTPKNVNLKSTLLVILTVVSLLGLIWTRLEPNIMSWLKSSEIEVMIRSNPPGALISVDEKQLSVLTPASVKMLKGKDVQITLTKAGYQKMAKLLSVESSTHSFSFELIPESPRVPMAVVTIHSEPQGASIFISDVDSLKKTPYDLPVAVGKELNIRLELPGYKSKPTIIKPDQESKIVKNIVLLKDNDLNKSKAASVKVRLPNLGSAPTKTDKKINLSVSTTPWSEVFIDGQKIGISPLIGARVGQGKHRLKFTNKQLGLKPLEVKVNFTQDADVRCIYDLQQRTGECK